VAASTGQRFVIRDVRVHPNWEPYREIADRAGIRASWSQPIRGSERGVLGTCAVHFGEPRTPEPLEERLLPPGDAGGACLPKRPSASGIQACVPNPTLR
jgi:GAF domain-containing protein